MPRKRKPWPGESASNTPVDSTTSEAGTAPGDPGVVADIVDVDGVSKSDLRKLLQRIDDLESKLKVAEQGRSEAEQRALDSAKAGIHLPNGPEEVPTGKMVKVKRLDKYETVGYRDDGRPILQPKFKTVEIPTFFYRIDMPPCGGTDLKINGQPYYHGGTYEYDIDTLRTVKDIVFRTWKHDADIHGTDENAYRPQQRPRLSARGMQ